MTTPRSDGAFAHVRAHWLFMLLVSAGGWACAGGAGVPQNEASPEFTLVHQILRAENARDTAAPALAQGASSSDTLVRALARRALARARDSAFSIRNTFPVPPSPPIWAEPSWKARYRELSVKRTSCEWTAAALHDPVVPVRLRALDLADTSCARNPQLVREIADLAVTGGDDWHTAAHALVALARLDPDAARNRLAGFRTSTPWQVRAYAARAAGMAGDTTSLLVLSRDADANVAATAVEQLSRLGGHGFDSVYVATLSRRDVQTTRVAATALRGSSAPGARPALRAALDFWMSRRRATERDVRLALLAALGEPRTADLEAEYADVLPEAAALALGAEGRVRVTMADGGAFTVRMRGDVAPIMAARILQLVSEGYYDGLTWHRVEHDFVIQGGSPGADEYVGYDSYLRDELGTVPHVRGTVGMSTRGHDTGDAQWFINLRDNLRLNGDYTVFGEVTEGMEVVDQVLEGDVIRSMRRIP